MSNTETRVIVIPSEYDQILDQLAEVPCPRCLGTQTIPAMSDNGPDAHEVDVCCDHCDGDGTGRGAYKTLAAFYGKARTELTQLRYYHWHTKQMLEKQAQGKPLQGCIDDLIGKHGSLRAVARECALDVGYLSCLHRGEKDNPSDATLEALGLRRHGAIYSLIA